MAIADDRLKQFFSKQKVGAFDALKQPSKATSPKNDVSTSRQEKEVALPVHKPEQKLENAFIEQSNRQDISPNVPVEFSDNNTVNDSNSVQVITQEPLAIRDQTVSNPLANRDQPVSDTLAIREQIVSKPLSDSLAKPLAKRDENQLVDLRAFSKKERELLTLVFWQCHNNGSLTSPAISTEEIRHTLKITAERVRNLIFRISKKGGIRVTQHKSGQSAYRVFELPKSLYQWMIDQQNNRTNRVVEPLAIPLSNPLATPPIYNSSSFLIDKKTTTSLPEDWKKINFEALVGIGFSETQLMQLYQSGNTTPQIVQESINLFAYSIEHREKTKSYPEPLNVLMGVLRKGQRWNEPDYVSPQDMALRQMLENKKKAKDKREQMIKELVDMEFPAWRAKLTDNQIKLIVPEATLRTNITAAITAAIKAHFVESVLLPRLEKMGALEIEQ